MTELEFNEALNRVSEEDNAFSCETAANCLMAYANRQHHLSVYQAKARQDTRAALRIIKQQAREDALDMAVRAAIAIGIVTVFWFLTAIGAA